MKQLHVSNAINDPRVQSTVSALHGRHVAHGSLEQGAFWSNGTVIELAPSLSYYLLMNTTEDLISRDRSHFVTWNPAPREKKTLSPAQRNLLLTLEFEKLLDYELIFRYAIIPSSRNNELPPGHYIMTIDPTVPHPKLGPLDRMSALDLYTRLLEVSTGEEVILALSREAEPYPKNDVTVRILGTIEDDENAFLIAVPPKMKFEPEGWCQPWNMGTVELAHRKQNALRRTISMRHIERIFGNNTEFTVPSINRSELPKTIVMKQGVFCVQGPPGTGKTHLACEVVAEMLVADPQARILVCAKEHLAVELLRKRVESMLGDACPGTSRLDPRAIKDPESMNSMGKGTSDAWAQRILHDTASFSDNEAWVQYCDEFKGQPPSALSELHSSTAQIVFSTTTSGTLLGYLYSNETVPFDMVIIEEASKCYPSELVPVLALGRSALLIGDQKQLPPFQIETVSASAEFFRTINPEAKRALVEKNPYLFSDALENGDYDWDGVVAWLQPFAHLQERVIPQFMLADQYRMIPLLSDLIGSIFYEKLFFNHRQDTDSLFSHPEIDDLRLCWIDIPHCSGMPEARENRSGLRVNKLELETVAWLFKEIRYVGTGKPDVAVLSPYNAQVDWLAGNHGHPAVLPVNCANIPDVNLRSVVHTVDSFQGHEADLVVLSLVRNNPLGSPRNAWGFMTSPERLNVMFSRARTHLVIIGSADHVRAHASHEDLSFMAQVLQYIENNGTLVSFTKLEVNM